MCAACGTGAVHARHRAECTAIGMRAVCGRMGGLLRHVDRSTLFTSVVSSLR
jgi:hypothetical protein